jgi:F0F1-type ATP synthase assembly protein I
VKEDAVRRTVVPELPVGQEQTLRALAASMQRNALLAGAALVVAAPVGGAVAAGVPGALSALLGVALGIGSSLFTLWLMRRSAHREPRAVMMASLGGYVQKMIILLVALFVAGSIPGVHRMSLAVGLLVTLIGVTAAEGWAGYRLRTAVVDPSEGDRSPATSGSATGLSLSSGGTGDGADLPASGRRQGPDHPG